MKQHTLLVCTTCASVWQNGKRVGESGGEKLLARIDRASQNWQLRDRFVLQPVACMSACSHACTVAFAAPEKHTYLFGDLPWETAADAVLECAELYHEKEDGTLAWAERPELLKSGIIAKVPPLLGC